MPYVALTALTYLLEQARTVLPEQLDVVDWEGQAHRRYAPWISEELHFLAAFGEHQRSRTSSISMLSQLLQRTPLAIDFRTRELRKQDRQALLRYPQVATPISYLDQQILLEIVAGQDHPLGDTLGWLFGGDLPLDWLQASSTPTLRVIHTRPADAQDALLLAQGIFADLAAALARNRLGCVLVPCSASPTRVLSLRDMIRRSAADLASPPRRTVRTDQPEGGATLPEVVLLDHPERWSLDRIDRLPVGTVLIVEPEETRLPHWRQSARALELVTSSAATNAQRRLARVHWPHLGLVPPHGTIVAPREDLLVRAASWWGLSNGQRPQLPSEIQAQLAQNRGLLHQYRQDAAASLNQARAQELFHLRLWHDLLQNTPEDSSAELQFALGDVQDMVYISY